MNAFRKTGCTLTGEKAHTHKNIKFSFTSRKPWKLNNYLTTTIVTSRMQFIRLFSWVKYDKGYPVNRLF